MSGQRLTGTDEHPIEHIPQEPGTLGRWVVALGGPAVWITHFMVVYLAAELSCAGLESDGWSAFGEGTLVVLTVVATVAAAVGCAALAVVARRRMSSPDRDRADFSFLGFLLSIGSILGVAAVGVPALFLSPVC